MSGVASQLDISRQALLDLSTRNRLLSIPRQSKSAKTIEAVGEQSSEVFRVLVKENKAFGFQSTLEDEVQDSGDGHADNSAALPQPKDTDAGTTGSSRGQRLQTRLTSEALQKRLLSLYYDAKTFEEEQGVNILYLALGMLKWYEDDNSDTVRHAPLLLVPVTLERSSAADRFKLRWREEDITTNLSLQAKLKTEFGLTIPDLPESDELDVSAYMNAVQEVVSIKKRFEVKKNDIVLGFFSFAKFLMYRDLDPAQWPENNKIDGNALIMGLMRDGFPKAEGLISEDAHVDEHLTPAQIMHVVDADSSQTLAIEEVRRGRNLVIQGPPGTGKSQTITNIIASAVAEGKKVLFVAEKMAALEVVHRRMSNIGLAPLCLELHSRKSNKKAVLDELKMTRESPRPRGHDADQAAAKLHKLRDVLNQHAVVLHTPHRPSGLTAFQIIGHLVRLKQDGVEARGIVLERPQDWLADDKYEREELLADVMARIHEISVPAQHPWRGVCRSQLLPNEEERLIDALAELRQLFERIMTDVATVESAFPSAVVALASLYHAAAIAQAVITMPDADYKALACPLWQNGMPLLDDLVQSGKQYAALKQKLSRIVADVAWTTDLTKCRQELAMHGKSIFGFLHSGYRDALALLKSLLAVPLPKLLSERLALIDDIMAVQKHEQFFQQQQEAGAAAFGRLWQDIRSDWSRLAALTAWRHGLPSNNLPANFLPRCAEIDMPATIAGWKELAMRLQQQVPEFFTKLTALVVLLQLDMPVAFNAASAEAIERRALADRLVSWIENPEALSKWIAFYRGYSALRTSGLAMIAEKLWSGDLLSGKAHAVFERAYFDVLSEEIFTAHPALREFDGDRHSALVANFRENDRYRIEQTRIEIRGKHYHNMPHGDSGIGALGILSGEFAKKRNHLPIRQLLKRPGTAIQALKPVFMMSPLSVAQFLEPGVLQFDLLVMDEASQVEPVDALGAIAGSRQIVVVGDDASFRRRASFLA